MRTGNATLLNFTLKFGDKNLKDYLEEIVIPAFTHKHEKWYGKKSRYLLSGVRIEDLGEGGESDPAIIGQFVKDTFLESRQVIVNGQLIEKRREIQSSPSATFALFINDHRLIYLADTPHAPDYNSFKSTILKFIRESRNQFIDKEYDRIRSNGSNPEKRILRKAIPAPRLNILPLPNVSSIATFVDAFDKIKVLTFKVVEPNDEAHAVQFWEDMQTTMNDLDADGTLTARNPSGMSKEDAKDVINGATERGIAKIKASGTGSDDEKLIKTNDDMKVEVTLDPMPPATITKVKRLHAIFKRMGLR